MGLVEELQKLEQLYRNGSLSAAEFAQAKSQLLSNPASIPDQAVAVLNKEAQLSRLDREWQFEQQNYMVRGRYGSQHKPSVVGGLISAFVIGGFGTLWTITTYSITSNMPKFGAFEIAQFMPLFGIIFTIFGIWSGINQVAKARAYQVAQDSYSQRRNEIERS